MRCVDLYNQTQSKWFEEMVTTSMVKKHLCQIQIKESCCLPSALNFGLSRALGAGETGG